MCVSLLSLTMLATAKQPAPDDGNYTFFYTDDFEDHTFVIGAEEFIDKKLVKEEIKWVKKNDTAMFWFEFLNDTKYKDDKLKDPLTEIHFIVNQLETEEVCTGDPKIFQTCTKRIISFDIFKAKNTITNESIVPIYPTLADAVWNWEWVEFWELKEYMETPKFYRASFYGIIDDVDPELELAITTRSDIIFHNNTNASLLGISILFNTTDSKYNGTKADFRSLVFYNNTGGSNYWNVTFGIEQRNETLNISTTANTNITLETRTATGYNTTDPDLISFWALNNDSTLDENVSTVYDFTKKHNGTIGGGATWSEAKGIIGGGFDFDGNGDVINIIDEDDFRTTGNISFGTWIYMDAVPDAGSRMIAGKWDAGGCNYGFYMRGTVDSLHFYDCSTELNLGYNMNPHINEWSHVFWVVHDENVSLFVNGMYKGSIAITPLTADDAPFQIGNNYLNIGWEGALDDIRYYNRTLTETEIADLYNIGNSHILWNEWSDLSASQDGVASQTRTEGKFSQFRANFNSNSTATSPYIINYSMEAGENPFPNINFTEPTLATGNRSTNDFIEVNISSSDEQGQHSTFVDFNKTLLRWFRLNGDTFFNDSSSYRSNASCTTRCPDFTPNGKFGGAYNFNGAAVLTLNNIKVNGSVGGTLSIWAKKEDATNVNEGLLGDAGGSNDYILYDSPDNHFIVEFATTATNQLLPYSPTLDEESWNHFVFTFQNLSATQYNLSLFVNGELNSSKAYNADILNVDRFGTGYLDPTNLFNGTLDDFQIHNRTLQPDEIKSLYNAQSTQYYNNFSNLGAGNYTIQAFTQDLAGQVNETEIRGIELVAGATPDTQPPYFVTIPPNATRTTIQNLTANFTAEDETLFGTFIVNDSTNFNINQSGFLTNITTLTVGLHNLNITINDSAGNTNFTFWNVNVIDATAPNCTLIEITPGDLEANSTGLFQMMVNCTDDSGINTTKVGNHYRSFFTMTVDDDGGTPNIWQMFYPENSLTVKDGLTQQVLRAVGRNESFWFDDLGLAELDANIYDYAVYDGNYGNFKIQNNGSNWAYFNITGRIENLLFKQAFPLNKETMHAEDKKEYIVNRNNGLMVKFFDLSRIAGDTDYTLTAFGNFNRSGTPNKDMNIYYCNQSYIDDFCTGDFTNGCSTTPQDNAANCVFLKALPPIALIQRDVIIENSSYIGDTYGINDGLIGGIVASNISYIYYRSQTTVGDFTIRYANGTSGTNVSFDNSSLAYFSTDDGSTYTTLQGTPDIFLNTVKEGDQLQLGGCAWDLAPTPNEFCSFNFYSDDIGAVNFPISSPTISSYAPGIKDLGDHTDENENLNGTYNKNMTVHINIAIDPDAIGNVTHNLSLMNTDHSFNYSINTSFLSPGDSGVHVYFDTSLVPDGLYTMLINATAGIDPNLDPTDSKHELIDFVNFTIDNTGPNITESYPIDGGSYAVNVTEFNTTISDVYSTISKCWYSLDNNVTNTTITCGNNATGLTTGEGNYIWTFHAMDDLGNNGSLAVSFSVDVVPPVVTVHEPTGEYTNETDINLNFSVVEISLSTCQYSLNGATNITIAPCNPSTNITFNGSVDGPNTMHVCANDTSNSWGCTLATFDLNTQTNTLLVLPQEETYLPTEDINITSFCRYTNGTLCGSDVTCRATSYYPNTTLFFADEFMTFITQGEFNYLRSPSSIIGYYSSSVSCYDGQTKEEAFTYMISAIDSVETTCLYKRFGYYDERLPFFRGADC